MGKNRQLSESLIEKFTKGVGLPFQEVLPRETIEKVLREVGVKYKNRIYNPIVIIWSFLSQVLDPDHSCQNAVSRIIAYLASEEKETPSENTSAYCKARKRIPEKVFKNLLEISSQKLEKMEEKEESWGGRIIKIIDGSTVSMPDTIENQKAYPQTSSLPYWMWFSFSQNWSII